MSNPPSLHVRAEQLIAGITQGEWVVAERNIYTSDICAANQEGRLLAGVSLVRLEGVANAAFIAAAPQLVRDLLAALVLRAGEQREQILTAGDSDNPIRALNTHGQTGTCLEHGSQLSSGKGHTGISPQASGQRDQAAERPAVRGDAEVRR